VHLIFNFQEGSAIRMSRTKEAVQVNSTIGDYQIIAVTSAVRWRQSTLV